MKRSARGAPKERSRPGEARGRLRAGTSGYQYRHWRGGFYPPDVPQRRWLAFYASRFDTVEVNGTFYSLPQAGTFDGWRDEAPPGFRFALKFSRYGSHLKRLKDPGEPIQRFLERAERLGARLGPILVQLPPSFRADEGRLADFLAAAPRRHLWAVEFRHPSWLREPVYDLLAGHDAALCVHDLLDDHPEVRTASWTYRRYHGPGPKYESGYSAQKLTAEARRIRGELEEGLDAYAYFNNDLGGHAPRDAADLRRYVESV